MRQVKCQMVPNNDNRPGASMVADVYAVASLVGLAGYLLAALAL